MNKQELIDKYIEILGGKVRNHADLHILNGHIYLWYPEGSLYKEHMCSIDEFEQRARQLGWINGYKYGVEYETNGKNPDLPDDLIIEHSVFGNFEEPVRAGLIVSWGRIDKFRIVDERYKPVEPAPEKEWYEKGELPPVGAIVTAGKDKRACEVKCHLKNFRAIVEYDNAEIGIYEPKDLYPLKPERERFVEVATSLVPINMNIDAHRAFAGALYDAGFKAPESTT